MEDAAYEPTDELMCRYCFESSEEGELIHPCQCAGGQKYVHLHCLRKWQRMVLVSQPTHPAFYDRDLRHQTCNVCKAAFTCPPPSRHELMASFTGPEIAGRINTDSLIAASEAFTKELQRSLEGMPPALRRRSSYDHWIQGVYLITGVEEDEGTKMISIQDAETLDIVRRRLEVELVLEAQGHRYHLSSGGALNGVAPESLREALGQLAAPCDLVLTPEEPPTCGDDNICAVNLTRILRSPPRPQQVNRAVAIVCAKYRGAANVKITHFLGGPCDEDELSCCIVLGGGGGCKGWTVVKDLIEAIDLAYNRAKKRGEDQGDIVGGQTVVLRGLQTSTELNGELGITLRFSEDSKRWLVRLRNGEGKQLRPANLEALEGSEGRVFAIWGDARWTRAQLLGEIAKGDWGLCHANIGDLLAGPSERWPKMAGRLAIAPLSAMTEEYMRSEMSAARAQLQRYGQQGAAQLGETGEEP